MDFTVILYPDASVSFLIMYILLLSFITALLFTYFAIPSIINIARIKYLFDEPGERKSHITRTPSLGGIAIFSAVLFSVVIWTPVHVFHELQYIIGAFIIIFLLGAKDDIVGLSPNTKLLGQLLAAIIVILKADVRLTNLYGAFDIWAIPYPISLVLSLFAIIVITNSFNLIDGINGLTGSIATLISLMLGSWFFLTTQYEFAIVSFALAGACIAFLKYNVTPAKIFMGDTGSLFVGFTSAILVIKFIELHRLIPSNSPYHFDSVPAVAFGILILPLFDTLRVFALRVFKGHSPFHADRTHIHHLLLDSGFSHMQATLILLSINFFFIVFVYCFQYIGTVNLLLLVLTLALLLTLILRNRSKPTGIRTPA